MCANYTGDASRLSDTARNAFQDLMSLGYDIEALERRNMNDDEVIELRDKAFRFRGMDVPLEAKGVAEFASLFELGVDLSLKSPPEEARVMASHILYLAEKHLADSE